MLQACPKESSSNSSSSCVCLLVGDSTGTCGHAAANAEPRGGDQHCQTSSSSSSSSTGTGEELSRPLAERNPPKRDRDREIVRERERGEDLVTEQRMRMQREGDVAEEAAGRQKQTGGQAV